MDGPRVYDGTDAVAKTLATGLRRRDLLPCGVWDAVGVFFRSRRNAVRIPEASDGKRKA